jgi:hypothetical protein
LIIEPLNRLLALASRSGHLRCRSKQNPQAVSSSRQAGATSLYIVRRDDVRLDAERRHLLRERFGKSRGRSAHRRRYGEAWFRSRFPCCSIPPPPTQAPIANSASSSPMPLPRIVVVPPTFAEIAELARTLAPSGFELVIVRNEHTELEAALATAEYLVCYPNVRTGDAFYRAAPSLRLHQLLSGGYDDVDLEAARRAKVPVSNNGGANAISVAEHAMMLMLMVSRRVISQHANVSSGRWRGNGPAPRMYEIHGKTLGIIGLGTIGKKVARLARAFGMQVQYYDIVRMTEDAEDALISLFSLSIISAGVPFGAPTPYQALAS